MTEQRVEKNKVVTFVYTIADDSGEVLEQSDSPKSYLHDQDRRMFPRVIQALEGRKEGDMVEVTLTPEEGFGHYDPDLTFSDRLVNVPDEYQQIGAEAEFHNDAGETATMRVTRIEDGMIYLDGNSPFAGKTVVFRITVADIRDASEQELARGQPADESRTTSLH